MREKSIRHIIRILIEDSQIYRRQSTAFCALDLSCNSRKSHSPHDLNYDYPSVNLVSNVRPYDLDLEPVAKVTVIWSSLSRDSLGGTGGHQGHTLEDGKKDVMTVCEFIRADEGTAREAGRR